MNMHLFISNNEGYLERDYDYCFRLVQDKETTEKIFPEWEYLGEFVIALPDDETEIRGKAIALIDAKAKEIKATAHAAIVELEARKQNLLAITHEAAG